MGNKMRNIGEIKIENAAAATISNIYMNNACDLCTVQAFGSATAMQIKIQGMTDITSDEWQDIAVFDLGTLELSDGSDGIQAAGVYAASIAGLKQIRINVISVTGSVSVTAAFSDTSAN